jgi:DNA-binding transcriptional MerR regulator
MKTVIEIARSFNISYDTVRHYTKLGMLTPQRDPDNGYRRYSLQDESRLRFLLSAKKLGFSLKDIRDILAMSATGDTACPLVRQLIDQRLAEVRREMLDAQQLLQRLELASSQWRQLPDKTPSGHSICHLIENWDNHEVDETSQLIEESSDEI